MGQRSFYVPSDGAPNEVEASIEEMVATLGPAPWRGPVIGTPNLRVVIHRWPPGHATVPHHHPNGHEVFMVLSGQAAFQIGDGPERIAGPGVLFSAPPGMRHAVRTIGHEPLLLFTAVSPNEDRADETIEEDGATALHPTPRSR